MQTIMTNVKKMKNKAYKKIKKIKVKSKIIQMMSRILEDLKEEGE